MHYYYLNQHFPTFVIAKGPLLLTMPPVRALAMHIALLHLIVPLHAIQLALHRLHFPLGLDTCLHIIHSIHVDDSRHLPLPTGPNGWIGNNSAS